MEPAPTVSTAEFPFHPWVGRSCRRALVWGLAALLLLALAVGWVEGASGWAWGRALGVLLAYSLLFWLTLVKIWWTARGAAVRVEADALAYQPLYAFRPRRVPFGAILAAYPRQGTHSLCLVVARRGVARELFLNLAVILGRRPFLAALGERLQAAGLTAVPGADETWARPGWTAPASAAG